MTPPDSITPSDSLTPPGSSPFQPSAQNLAALLHDAEFDMYLHDRHLHGGIAPPQVEHLQRLEQLPETESFIRRLR